MKALLINPPTGKYMRDERCQVPVESRVAEPPRPPMDLAYMAAVLEQRGLKCMIKDYPMYARNGWPVLEKDIRGFAPDFLVISTTTPTLYDDITACTIAKHVDPHITTIAKGAHFLVFDTDVLRTFSDLDVVMRGETEMTIAEIASGSDLRRIKGITFRSSEGDLVRNEDRPLVDDLNALPYPARHLLDNALYRTPDTGEPITFIYTARGCPAQCLFCAAGLVSGRTLRVRTIPGVIGEIEECVRTYHIKNFFFRADTFTWNKEWVIGLCKEIVRRRMRIRWGTNSRVDTIDAERVAWMQKAGCRVIGFGAESGSQEILHKMRKHITVAQIEEAVRLCRAYGIDSFLHFVIGLPWDTRETIADTARFMRKVSPSFVEVNIAYPIPGTDFYDICSKEGLFEQEVVGRNHISPATRTYALSGRQLVEARKEMLRQYYMRPAYIFDSLARIRSPRIAWNYCKAGYALWRSTL
ncbi:MAG TPA: radical SAM protein [Patescibacteria group bacterium]|nr:radical SAM protein [Patescibacteria group bacterium]